MSTYLHNKPEHMSAEVACDMCLRRFTSITAMHSHKLKTHNIKNSLRNYVNCAWCPVCLKLFHSRVRVLHHVITRSKKCGDYLIKHFPTLPANIVEQLDAADAEEQRKLRNQGLHRRKSFKPVIQMYGPKLEGA